MKIYFTVFFCILIGVYSVNAEWIHLESGVNDHLYGVNFVDEDFGYAVGWGASSGAVALKTVDGGENWESTILSNNSFIFSITTVDEDKAFGAGCLNAGSADAIFKTTNAGENWSYNSLYVTYGMYDVEFPTSEIGFACGWQGKIFKTTNGGTSWSQLNSGTGNVLRWMYFVDENTGYIVGGTNWNNPNRVYKTTNGGTNWSQIHNFGGGTVIGGIHFFDENEGIAVGHNGNEAVLKTYDGGSSWEVKHTGTSSSILQSVHSEDNNCWAVGGSGRILYSDDFGETWTLDDNVIPAVTLLGVYEIGQFVYAVGESGNIFRKELPPDMIADFTAEPTSGDAPLTVQFTDLSSENPFLWWWDFENDGVYDSYEQNPVWIYDQPGIYSISLTVNNGQFEVTEIKEDYIVVNSTHSNDETIDYENNILWNYPNPFNSTTKISFQFNNEQNQHNKLIIFNIKGQKVRCYSIFNPSKAGQGNQSSISWDGTDETGKAVTNGIYFYQLQTDGISQTKKMILIK